MCLCVSQRHLKRYEIVFVTEPKSGSNSPQGTPNMNGKQSLSRESLACAAAVRARVKQRMERPHSLADGPGIEEIVNIFTSRAFSELDQPYKENKKNFSLRELKRTVAESQSSEEIAEILRGPKRSSSLADFIFRRKNTKLAAATAVINVIENPMNALNDAETDAA